MSSTKPKTVPTRLVEPFDRGEYKMPRDLQQAARRANSQPVLISVNSRVRPAPVGEK